MCALEIFMEKPRFITFRVSPKIYKRWDDIRHSAEDSWQRIGMDLFGKYFHEREALMGALVPISEQIAPPIATESDSEIYSLLSRLNIKQEDLGGDLLKILKSDKALAKEYVRLGILAGMRCLKYDE